MGGNRFLFTEFQPQEGYEHSCLEPSYPIRPSTSLVPLQPTSQNHAQKFPLSVLKLTVQTNLHPLWKLHWWASKSPSSCSSSLLQNLRYVVLSFHIVVQENCAMLHWIMVKSKKGTSPKKVTSLYVPGPKSPDRFWAARQQVSILCGRVLGRSQLEGAQSEQQRAGLSLSAAASSLRPRGQIPPGSHLLPHGCFSSLPAQATWPDPQRNRHSPSLSTGSMAASLSHGCLFTADQHSCYLLSQPSW